MNRVIEQTEKDEVLEKAISAYGEAMFQIEELKHQVENLTERLALTHELANEDHKFQEKMIIIHRQEIAELRAENKTLKEGSKP